MDTKYILEQFRKTYTGLDIEVDSEEEDGLRFHAAHCNLKPFDDDILLRFCFYETATIVEAVFDQMERSLKNFELLNDFNSNNLAFAAFIEDHGERNYLHVRAVGPSQDEDEGLNVVRTYLNLLLADSTKEELLKLTAVTF